MRLVALMLLAVSAIAQDAPFYPRSTQANQDMGGINKNFSDLTSRSQCKLNQGVTPDSCAAGQALTGACFNSGYTAGGSCVPIGNTSSTNTWTQSQIIKDGYVPYGIAFATAACSTGGAGQCSASSSCPTGKTVIATQCVQLSGAGSPLQNEDGGSCVWNCSGACTGKATATCITLQ